MLGIYDFESDILIHLLINGITAHNLWPREIHIYILSFQISKYLKSDSDSKIVKQVYNFF